MVWNASVFVREATRAQKEGVALANGMGTNRTPVEMESCEVSILLEQISREGLNSPASAKVSECGGLGIRQFNQMFLSTYYFL